MSEPKKPPDAGASGSVDIDVDAGASGARESGPIPQPVPSLDSEPVASGGIGTTASPIDAGEVRKRSRRISQVVQDRVSGGVERIGAGIGTLGEGVSKLGDVTKRVPIVGSSVGKLGEGITKAGESIHALPQVARTRRGRLLVRSVVVGFVLVFAWIAIIVAVQLRSHDTPDFRPLAERILVEISKGPSSIGEVYEKASPRFQELVRKEQFVDNMLDMNATNGKFREITSINETIVTRGRTGRVGRVSLTASFEKGTTRGSISFHWDKGGWKLLGVSIEVPPAVSITQAEREKRVAACIDDKGKDVSDQRGKCDVRDAAETILELIRDGKAGEVWNDASDVFKQQETRASFIRIEEEHRLALGNYKRLLTVTEARAIEGTRATSASTATFDVLAEFDKSSGVRVVFGFTRSTKFARWQLRSFKVVVPMPRPEDAEPLTDEVDINPNAPPLPGIAPAPSKGKAPSTQR